MTELASSPRHRILETSSRLFYEHGYHVTGINQIISEAKVAKASFYQHFPSKQQLAQTYINNAITAWADRVEDKIYNHIDPTERLLALFIALEKWVMSSEYHGCWFLNISVEFRDSPKLTASVRNHKDHVRQLILKLIEEIKIKSSIAEIEDIANTTYLLYEGGLISSLVHRDVWPIQAARKAVRTLIG